MTFRAPEVFDGVALDLVEDLRAVIVACAGPGTPHPGGANRGGWKSRTDLLDWKAPVLGELKARIERDYLRDLSGRAGYKIGPSWAIVNKNGSQHGRHRHGTPVSGVYYVTTGDPLVPTIFELGGRATVAGQEVHVLPRVGRLCLMGDLWHRVPLYEGDEPRITIAFDVKR